ncbi:LysR family transcriptional regulator (plasmid) [Pseudomonas luteola]|uniref:LysR family transcriptional regulator n=1 Tax=Pseudomonas luteola TaxID=47886 RepID=UPI003890682F
MDTLLSMRAFVRVASTGSFTAAASDLKLSVPYVSRAVSYLEHKLKARLLHRTTRRLSLTAVGHNYLIHAKQIISHIDEAEAEAVASDSNMEGSLSIFASAGLGQSHLVRAVSKFQEKFPGITIELETAYSLNSSKLSEYDAALVLVDHLPNLDMRYQFLEVSGQTLCASVDYLQEFGIPNTLSDLAKHRWLKQKDTLKDATVEFEPVGSALAVAIPAFSFETNTMESLREAIAHGMGIGILPSHEFNAHIRDSNLVKVLPAYNLPYKSIFSLYPARSCLGLRVRTWLDFIRRYSSVLREIPRTSSAGRDSYPCRSGPSKPTIISRQTLI